MDDLRLKMLLVAGTLVIASMRVVWNRAIADPPEPLDRGAALEVLGTAGFILGVFFAAEFYDWDPGILRGVVLTAVAVMLIVALVVRFVRRRRTPATTEAQIEPSEAD